MGIIICKEHGRQTFHEICEHAYSDMINGINSQTYYIEVLNLKLCEDCYKTNSFQEVENLKVEEIVEFKISESESIEKKLTEKYNLIKRKAICKKCYSNYKK
ncbi:hypothetical protein [Psychroserpens sp. MEBiC05023]